MLRRLLARSPATLGCRTYSTLTPPLVDVRSFHEAHGLHSAQSESAREAAAKAAAAAAREHGLLALPAYGGIPPALVTSAFESVKHLFQLPMQQKLDLAYRDVRENVGYIREGNETPDPEQAAPDPKEVFQYQPGKRALPPELEEPLRALFDAGMAAGRATLRCLARSLALPDDTFARALSTLDQCTLRAVHYRGGTPPLANRCGAHTDFGACTLLLNEHGGPPGLQASDPRSGAWRHVTPPDGAQQGGVGVAFVNLGGMLERWTNDEVVATRHRVVAPADAAEAARSRYVLALFCDADTPVSLACLPRFQSGARPARYAPMTAGDYKAMRLGAQTDVE